ncbi:hypothetical protein MUP59_01910, partial [Candidatus Bathyarchaeota archaeon]|nr:hypothetical protein [Candidatus Bathyarchaeota archaeon]
MLKHDNMQTKKGQHTNRMYEIFFVNRVGARSFLHIRFSEVALELLEYHFLQSVRAMLKGIRA